MLQPLISTMSFFDNSFVNQQDLDLIQVPLIFLRIILFLSAMACQYAPEKRDKSPESLWLCVLMVGITLKTMIMEYNRFGRRFIDSVMITWHYIHQPFKFYYFGKCDKRGMH